MSISQYLNKKTIEKRIPYRVLQGKVSKKWMTNAPGPGPVPFSSSLTEIHFAFLGAFPVSKMTTIRKSNAKQLPVVMIDAARNALLHPVEMDEDEDAACGGGSGWRRFEEASAMSRRGLPEEEEDRATSFGHAFSSAS
jgi:hypothetical protein